MMTRDEYREILVGIFKRRISLISKSDSVICILILKDYAQDVIQEAFERHLICEDSLNEYLFDLRDAVDERLDFLGYKQ